MKTMTWSMALAVALAFACAPGQAQGKLPRSVAEQRAMAETSGRWPSFRLPPGNVRAEDYRALFGQYRGGVRRLRSDRDSALCVEGGLHWQGRTLSLVHSAQGRPLFPRRSDLVVGQNKTEIAFVADIRKRHQGKTRAGSARFMTPRPATRSGMGPGAGAGAPGI